MKKLLALLSVFALALPVSGQDDAHVLLSSTYGGPSSSFYDQSFIASTPTGENVVATMIFSGTEKYINLKKISLSGSLSTLNNILVNDEFHAITDMVCEPDGGYVVCVTNFPNMYVIRFSPAGGILWQKQLSFPDAAANYFNASIERTSGGEYYLSTNHWSYLGIIKLDSNGNQVWGQKIIGPFSDSTGGTDGKCPGFCTSVTQAGGCVSTLKDENFECVVNLDANGQVIWSRSFIGASYRWPRCIEQDAAGNFIIMGTQSSSYTYFHKLDANGNVLLAKTTGYGYVYEDFKLGSSGEMIAIGTSYSDGSSILTKLDANANALWSAASPGFNMSYNQYGRPHIAKGQAAGYSFLLRSPSPERNFLVTKFSGELSGLCNFDSKNNPVTTDDLDLMSAEVSTDLVVYPLSPAITNASFTTTTTDYYTASEYCQTVAGITEDEATASVNVFPNPFTESATVSIRSSVVLKNAEMQVYDMIGKNVVSVQAVTTHEFTFEKNTLAPGVYLYRIMNDSKQVSTGKLMIR